MEKKNKSLMAYLELVVLRNVLEKMEVIFRTVGDTNSDIYQAFSTESKRLRTHEVVSLKDHQQELSQCYNSATFVTSMNNCINWWKFCDNSKCIRKIANIMSYQFIQSLRKKKTLDDEISSSCLVRTAVNYKWVPIHTAVRGQPSAFLSSEPDLRRTPPEELTSPSGLKGVTARLTSEEGRIQNPQNMQDLFTLRGDVYKTRSVSFIGIQTNPSRPNGHEETRLWNLQMKGFVSLSTGTLHMQPPYRKERHWQSMSTNLGQWL